MPLPALVSTITSWPAAINSATDAGRQADSIFVNLDLLRDADAHDLLRICRNGRVYNGQAGLCRRCERFGPVLSPAPPRQAYRAQRRKWGVSVLTDER